MNTLKSTQAGPANPSAEEWLDIILGGSSRDEQVRLLTVFRAEVRRADRAFVESLLQETLQRAGDALTPA